MAKAKPAALRELVKTLYLQGLQPQAIGERLAPKGITANLVSSWAKRGAWTALRLAAKQSDVVALQTVPEDPASAQEARVRAKLADELEAQVATLAREPVAGYGELPGRDGRTATLRQLVDTGAGLYGWGKGQGTIGTINVKLLQGRKLPPKAQVIDVQADKVESE